MKKLATILTDHFEHWGLTHVFGIPGKAISPILFELLNTDIEFVLSKHEGAAGFEASGYAMMKNTPGVAIGTSGPGGTNLLTAAGQAKAFHAPLLIITGHPSMKDTGKGQGQDSSMFGTDLCRMFEPVTKFSARVEYAERLAPLLSHALEKAVTEVQGPVHLSIPFDILLDETEPFLLDLPNRTPTISPETENLIPLLNRAEKPVLFVGKGVHASRAYEEVEKVAEHWQIPVVTTPGGKGAFRTDHNLSLGGFGLGGTEEAAEYLKGKTDLMLVLGTRLSDMSLPGFTDDMLPDQVFHFDYDPTFIGKSLFTETTAVLGDLKANLQTLLSQSSTGISHLRELPEPKQPPEPAPTERMSAVSVINAMRNTLSDDTILFGDDGSHSFYGIRHFDIRKPGTYFFDDIFGAMGNGIGFSVGAALADPGAPVVCLTGDGCMFMHGTEISTAYNYNAPVLFIIMNNERLDMVEKGMRKMIGTSIGGVYETPLDGKVFANSMGLDAYKCHTSEDIEKAVITALQTIKDTNKPVVIEAIIDGDEIPPTMGRQ
ncbi:thiamine pyrophosphate-binding protein [Salimicrobium flavidum]|uniref:Acetolactate synthase-1/2/3 large subunit n=1 Tax=Salimicrobium flavidum TaxID=570947 RepID=A0A1N7IZB6_9BACI|nr:thiamine pyrophosphate-binding protein [Salimicrobium flavidum]SIS42448.1 acetolactate synthase-1/2/3 large subunit [Salimicrobium flavidum]